MVFDQCEIYNMNVYHNTPNYMYFPPEVPNRLGGGHITSYVAGIGLSW